MKPEIALITIWTDNVPAMKRFYSEILGFGIQLDLGEYVEFESKGVRFAVCARSIMYPYTERYRKRSTGQSFELAFPCENVNELDSAYNTLLERGVQSIHPPEDMPWNQRTALFADPDGNIHELFTEIEQSKSKETFL